MIVGGATSVRILNSLHRNEKQTPSSTLMTPVTFDSPSKFLIPKGRYHRAALKICSDLKEIEIQEKLFTRRFITVLIIFFTSMVLVVFFNHT